MKNMKKPAILWGIAGLVLSLCVLIAAVYGMNSSPAMLADPASVTATAEQALECVRSGNFEELETLLSGNTQLGDAPSGEDTAESLIWQAFLESVEYEIAEEVTTSANGVCVNVHIRCLDIAQLSDTLQETVPELIRKIVTETEDKSKIYDAERNYQDTFLAEVLLTATKQILTKQLPTTELDMVLNLVPSADGWQVAPTEELLQFLTGFVA